MRLVKAQLGTGLGRRAQSLEAGADSERQPGQRFGAERLGRCLWVEAEDKEVVEIGGRESAGREAEEEGVGVVKIEGLGRRDQGGVCIELRIYLVAARWVFLNGNPEVAVLTLSMMAQNTSILLTGKPLMFPCKALASSRIFSSTADGNRK